MKKSCFIISAFLLIGCVGKHQNTTLTAEQAKMIAMRLANDKAFSIYQCRPFRGSQPARFVSDHWIWIEQQGIGRGDVEATVELAANGSTCKVDLQLLYLQPF